MKKILVSVTNDLTTDQRVHKVCTTLIENGFEVTLIGRKLKHSLDLNREYKTIRMQLFYNNGFLFYAEYNLRLFFKLLFLKKDILHSNDLDTLLPNYLIAKLLKKPLVYDSHELFTEVPELVDRPKVQQIWSEIEKKIVPRLKNCITVCDSIASFYEKKYNVPFQVVKNVPKTTEIVTREFIIDTENKYLLLYQGAVNKGRGIELMLESMKLLKEHILVIIGNGDLFDELKFLAKNEALKEKVHFLGSIVPEELKTLTPLATIGLSLEEDLGLNYRYALPNKLFDYIQAEVPCLVSDLPEMKKIVLDNKIGEVLKKRTPLDLANQIEDICKNKSKYNSFKKHLQLAKQDFNWEMESEKLIYLYKNII
ncbi:glycosyltransferase [Flavicella marina]|uniref:glycosyltransferase n=1 Tax=Flavicella marina TaxID=1475951 RepID=UPI00126424EF|nr:glycosyltransferase [Flavicella marina]